MQPKKIHLACGNNIFDGWENYDFAPINAAKHINLLEKLPFSDNSVNFIYFEHALEHFDEVDGFNLLNEFHRVLVSDGVIRLITPSLDTYIKRYLNWNDDINVNHRTTFNSAEQFLNYAFFGENITSDIKFLNNKKSSNIGHKYIYSEKDLLNKCNKIAFKKSYVCKYNVSSYEELNNKETRVDNLDLIVELIK